MKTIVLLAAAFAVTQAFGQAAFPPPPPKVSPAVGVIDMHTHTHPDVFGRNIVFANSFGAHISYGAAVTKISEELDGVYNTVPIANFGTLVPGQTYDPETLSGWGRRSSSN